MKKVNFVNVIIGFLSLGLYLFFFIKNGSKLINSYDLNLLYAGSFFALAFIMFALFKKIRNSMYMDIIFMFYLLFFIFFNVLGEKLVTKNIYVLFINYPFWLKYLIGVLFIINVVFFVRDLKKWLFWKE